MSSRTREYWLGVDLRGNDRFPEASSVMCVVEWDARRPLDELRRMAAEFYGVALEAVGPLRETPISMAKRDSSAAFRGQQGS